MATVVTGHSFNSIEYPSSSSSSSSSSLLLWSSPLPINTIMDNTHLGNGLPFAPKQRHRVADNDSMIPSPTGDPTHHPTHMGDG